MNRLVQAMTIAATTLAVAGTARAECPSQTINGDLSLGSDSSYNDRVFTQTSMVDPAIFIFSGA